MQEGPLGFSYTWKDLQPVRPLVLAVLAAQIAGAAIALWLDVNPSLMGCVRGGAAVATFPGFLIGLALQVRLRPRSLARHKTMVRRIGLVAAAFSLAGFVLDLS